MGFGKSAVDVLATSSKKGEIHFRELDKTFCMKFVTCDTLVIECIKLNVYDKDGNDTCEIADHNICKLRSLIVYKANSPLEAVFTFLDSSFDKKKLEGIRGILDLFMDDKRFGLSLYIIGTRPIYKDFDTDAFGPGCYSDCSKNGFMQLNKFRQTIFQTINAYFDKLNIASPI